MGYLIGISLDGGTGSDSRYVSLAIFLVFSVRFFYDIKINRVQIDYLFKKKNKSFKYLNLKNRTTFRFCLIMSFFYRLFIVRRYIFCLFYDSFLLLDYIYFYGDP